MRVLGLLALAAVVALVAIPAPASGQILDGAAGGRAGFYFLPPMVADPGVAGNFDADLSPEADICVLDTARTACTATNIAEFDTSGTGSAVITVDVGGESYNAVWSAPKNLTLSSNSLNNPRYRLEVFQQVGPVRARLGYADLWVVNKTRDLKAVPAGFVGVVRGSPTQIKFRVQTTAVGLVDVTPNPASIPLGGAQVFTAGVVDLHGDPMSGLTVDWATDPTGLASLDPTASTTNGDGEATTTATGDSVGDTTVTATAGGVLGSAELEVFSPAPVAEDDAFTTTIGDPDVAENVTGNDYLGVPAGTVTSFGGGDLGGDVADNPAGSSVALAGGSLTLTADGTLTLAGPTLAGVYTFDYRVTNTAGSEDAMVTITVQRVPDAVEDTFAVEPGTALAGDVLADNGAGGDDRGFPQGDVASFGGGDLGGNVDSNAAGASVTLVDGSVSLAADGTLSGTAPTATGTYTFDYRLSNIAGSDTATVTLTVRAAPVAEDDAYTTTIGDPDLAENVTGNDDLGVPAGDVASFGGGSLGGTVTDSAAGASIALAGGTLTLGADGALSLSGATVAGVYTFDYRVTNTAGSDDATVTITVQRVPNAVDDTFAVEPGTALADDVLADNGAGADDRGFLPGDVASFGGGDLGGNVDSNAAGASVTLGDGSVSLATDGTLSGTAPTATGTYTFDYRLSNDAGTDTATVTLTVQRPPTAADDAFTTTVPTTLNGDVFADNGSGADDRGDPAGDVATFGGGDLAGTVETNAAGSSVSLAGGTLTLNADGTLTLASPATGGVYTFDYRLANAAGHSDATVTITVNQAPAAVDDAPAGTSVPGDAWHTAFDTALDSTTHATPSVLTNDTLGFPTATVTHFGGGTLGGAVTDHAAGATATVDGHSLTVGADGELTYTPKTGFTGLFTFSYRIANDGGTSDAAVTIAVGHRPVAVADAYPHTLVGNVGVDTATGTPFSVLGNDGGDDLSVTAGAPTNGDVTLNADGTFTFNPAAGFRSGNATFTYTVTNGFGTSAPATVTIPVGAQVIWFVNNAAPECTTLAGGCGRLTHPLSSLAAFQALNDGVGNNPADNHHVFLYESATAYTGPVTLRSGQRLVGQDATSTLAALTGVTLPAHSPALPVMDSGNATRTTITSAANAVVLGQGNRLHGFRLGNAGGTALTATGFGTLVVSDVAVETTGRALNLENGTAGSPFAFTSVTSSGGTNNVRLAAGSGVLSGTFDLGGGALSGSTAEAFLANGGTANVTYSGSITNTVNRSVSVANKTAGTVTLSGAVSDTGTGVTLTGNTGATMAFTGPLTIQTAGTGFSATGGGTVRTTAATNTLTTTATGPALRIENTTIHADGVAFQRISSTGGTNGIVLASTGSAGGLTVTGTGTAASGGTIQNTTGDGISLTSTRDVALDRMVVQNNLGSGINGSTVTNLTLANSTVSGNGDDVAADEAGMRFTNLVGAATFNNVTVFGSIEDNARVINTSGNLTFAMTASTIRDTNAGPGGNNGLLLQADGTATITADIDSSSFLRNRANGVQVVTNGGGTIDVDLGTTTANTYTDNNIGVSIAHNSSGTLTFDVAGSTFSAPTRVNDINQPNAASPINLNLGGLGNTMSGTVSGNTITNNNSLTGPGIRVISNGTGTMTVAVDNNTISQVANYGIETLARDGSSTINATYTNNSITLNHAGALDGIRVNSGAVSTDTTTVCADLSGNTVSTSATNDIRVRNRFVGTTFRLESYAGSATDMAAVIAYLQGRNTITTAAADRDAANAGFLPSAGCPTP